MLPLPFRHRLFPALLMLLLPSSPLLAQAAGQPLTLTVQSRIVLEDVLVFDRSGKPVFGLPASAFHVTDNGHPQMIRSFDDGATTPDGPAVPSTPLPREPFATSATPPTIPPPRSC